MREQKLDRLTTSGVVAILRGAKVETVTQVATALYQGGLRALEITVDAPGALTMIERLRAELPDDLILGAGTVLDAPTARAAVQAGCDFIFTPTLELGVIEMGNRYDRMVIPGTMTPTEMQTAIMAGAAAVKLFPASVVGPDFIRQVKAPLPHIPIIATGGVHAGNAAEYIRAGAVALGVGSWLTPQASIASGAWDDLTQRAAGLVESVRQARGE